MGSSSRIEDKDVEAFTWNSGNGYSQADSPVGYSRMAGGPNAPIGVSGSSAAMAGGRRFPLQLQIPEQSQRHNLSDSSFFPEHYRTQTVAESIEWTSQKYEQSQQRIYESSLPPPPPLRVSPPTSLKFMEGKATFAQCFFNMANVLMGVGLLGLPYAFMCAGWLGGSFVLLSFGIVTWRTSILIGQELNGDPRQSDAFSDSPYRSPLVPGSVPEARLRRPLRTFPDIARESFGNVGCIVLSIVLYFELFSCLCIYLVILADHAHSLFPSLSVIHHTVIVAALSAVPTVVLRTPSQLAYLSMVGTFATVAVVSAVVSDSLIEGDSTKTIAEAKGLELAYDEPTHILWRSAGLPLAFGIVAYCFSGHALVPSIYSSMKQPQDFDNMITGLYPVVVGCSFLVALSGYYMFGVVVDDQITLTLALQSSNSFMKCLTWLMIMTAFSKFSLSMLPLALGMEELYAPYIDSEEGMLAASCAMKLVITILALLVAIFIPSFSFLCAFVGLICTIVVSVIFPAAAHLQLFHSTLTLGEKRLDWFFIVFGCVAAVAGTVATL